MNRVSILVITTLLMLLAVGCDNGGSDNPTMPAATRASVQISVSPNPVIAADSSNPAYRYQCEWDVTLTEVGGLGCNVNFIDVTLRNRTTGVEVGTFRWGASDIIANAGTNHIYAHSSLTHHQGIVYTLAFGGRQAILTISADLTDDRGNHITASIEVDVV